MDENDPPLFSSPEDDPSQIIQSKIKIEKPQTLLSSHNESSESNPFDFSL